MGILCVLWIKGCNRKNSNNGSNCLKLCVCKTNETQKNSQKIFYFPISPIV